MAKLNVVRLVKGVVILGMIIAVIILWIVLIGITTPKTVKQYRHGNIRTVCSLTTRPEQPYYFHYVLDRLVTQFDAVYLAVPKISCKGIVYPTIEHPGVTVVTTSRDYGPITKYFGALKHEKNPNTLIVVVDDDIIYNQTLRKQYEEEHRKHPNDVLSGAGIVYKYWGLPWYLSLTGRRPNFPRLFPSLLGDKRTTTVAGYSGVAFPRRLLDESRLIQFIQEWSYKECFFNDDIVISAYFSINGVQRLFADVDDHRHPEDKDTPSLSAEGIHVTQHKVFLRMRECFKNDPTRHDCICAVDIIILLFLLLLGMKIGFFTCGYSKISGK